jgi:hypothetical protein
MTTVVVLLVILVIVLGLGWWATRYRRTHQLRQRFGDEYDRTLERTGSRRDTERTLSELAQRREQLRLRPLTAQQREAWVLQWNQVQSRFVDAPAEAVAIARELLPGLMRDRGYPTEDFDRRAALLATDHPVVVSEYRAAEQAYQRHLSGGGSSTEGLRQSLVHYRALFDALVDPRDAGGQAAPAGAGDAGEAGDETGARPASHGGRHATGAPADSQPDLSSREPTDEHRTHGRTSAR